MSVNHMPAMSKSYNTKSLADDRTNISGEAFIVPTREKLS